MWRVTKVLLGKKKVEDDDAFYYLPDLHLVAYCAGFVSRHLFKHYQKLAPGLHLNQGDEDRQQLSELQSDWREQAAVSWKEQ